MAHGDPKVCSCGGIGTSLSYVRAVSPAEVDRLQERVTALEQELAAMKREQASLPVRVTRSLATAMRAAQDEVRRERA